MPGWDSLPKPLRDHVGLIASALVAFFVAVRVFAVSGFQSETALVLLETQGTASILMGTIIPAFPLVPLAVSTAALAVGTRRDAAKLPSRSYKLVAFGGLFVGVMFLPVAMIVTVPVLTLVALWVVGLLTKGQPSHEFLKGMSAGMLALTVAIVTLGTTPWLPHERIENGTDHVDGHVLEVRGKEMIVLRDEHRAIVSVPADAQRRFCTKAPKREINVIDLPWDWLGRTPLELVVSTKPPVECDDLPG